MIALIGTYIFWHYTIAFKDLSVHLKNFIWFFFHFFSIPVLFKTFFEPWKRMEERYPRGIDIGGMMSTFIINTMMRTIGVIMRGILLIGGCITLFIVSILGIACFAVWFLMPAIAVILFISGARLLFI